MAEKVADLSIVISAKNAANRTLGQIRGQFDTIRRAVFSLQGALAGLGLAFGLRELVDAQLSLDRITNSLKAATGSSERAKQEFGFVRSEAQRLGLDLQATALEYAKLTAAAKGTALEGQKTRDIFTAVSEASVTLGLDAQQTGGALTAIQQIISKGTVSAEELRGQLGERLPGAFQIAARAIGVTTQELGKMLEQGELTAEQLLPAMARELRVTFGSQVQDAANSLNAKLNRMNTAFFELKVAIAQSGLIDFIASATDRMTALLEKLARFQEFIKKIRDPFGLEEKALQRQKEQLFDLSKKLRDLPQEFQDSFLGTTIKERIVELQKAIGIEFQFNETATAVGKTLKDQTEAMSLADDATNLLGDKTLDLANNQKMLGDELKKTKQELTPVQEAFNTLGIQSEQSIHDQISRIQGSLQTLRESGEASFNDLARAEARVQNQTRRLLEELEPEKVERIKTAWERLTEALIDVDQAQLKILQNQREALSQDLSAAEKRVEGIRKVLDVESELKELQRDRRKELLGEELVNFQTLGDVQEKLADADRIQGQERIRLLREAANEAKKLSREFEAGSLLQTSAFSTAEEALRRLSDELKKQENLDPTKSIKDQFIEAANSLDEVREKFEALQKQIKDIQAVVRIADQEKLMADADKLKKELVAKFSAPIEQQILVKQKNAQGDAFSGFTEGPLVSRNSSSGSDSERSGVAIAGSGLPIRSFAVGIRSVPRDMIARLHEKERVLTARENRELESGGLGSTRIIFGDINVQVGSSTEAPEVTARRIHEELKRIDERKSV